MFESSQCHLQFASPPFRPCTFQVKFCVVTTNLNVIKVFYGNKDVLLHISQNTMRYLVGVVNSETYNNYAIILCCDSFNVV